MTDQLSDEQRDIIKNWQESFLGKALAKHTRDYFYEHTTLKDIPENAKQELIGEFYKKIFEMTQSEEPLLTMRGYIASYVHSYAMYQVLCLTESEKNSSAFKDSSGISGELHQHIRKLAEHHVEIKSLAQKDDSLSDEELLAFCRIKTVISMFYMNGMNIVRCEMKDMIKEGDWLRPFISSMLIWEEDNNRKHIGLPCLLATEEDAQRHASFLNYVTKGSTNPLFAWEAGDVE